MLAASIKNRMEILEVSKREVINRAYLFMIFESERCRKQVFNPVFVIVVIHTEKLNCKQSIPG